MDEHYNCMLIRGISWWVEPKGLIPWEIGIPQLACAMIIGEGEPLLADNLSSVISRDLPTDHIRIIILLLVALMIQECEFIVRQALITWVQQNLSGSDVCAMVSGASSFQNIPSAWHSPIFRTGRDGKVGRAPAFHMGRPEISNCWRVQPKNFQNCHRYFSLVLSIGRLEQG